MNETHCICFQTKNKLISVNQKIMPYVFLKILTFKWNHGRYHGHLTGVTQTFLEKFHKKHKLPLVFLCHCDFMVRAQDFLSLFDHSITAHSIVIPISLGDHFPWALSWTCVRVLRTVQTEVTWMSSKCSSLVFLCKRDKKCIPASYISDIKVFNSWYLIEHSVSYTCRFGIISGVAYCG